MNCCGEPGSLGYEGIDMEFFARVGCDHVMVDWCRSYVDPKQMKEEYARIGDGIANSANPNMLYGIWPGGMGKSWKWSANVGGHYWRTASDIKNVWDSDAAKMVGGVLHNFDTAMSIPNIAARTVPGRYTFLDQMVVGVAANGTGDDNHKGGVPGPGLDFEETQAHMSMWVMAASPLLTCNDARNMSAAIKEILTNPEVLAVHKDPLAKMGVRIDVGGGVEEKHATHPCTSGYSVYGKELSDGSSAVMVLNRGDVLSTRVLTSTTSPALSGATPHVLWAMLSLPNSYLAGACHPMLPLDSRLQANLSVALPMENVGDSMHDCYAIRDLWQHRNLTLGRVQMPTTKSRLSAGLTLVVPRHGVRMLRLWPLAPPPPPPLPTCPVGFTAHAGGYWQNAEPSGAVGSGTVPTCAATCKAKAHCVAFEVYTLNVPSSQDECYLFLKEMTAPFTPDLHSFTCVLA